MKTRFSSVAPDCCSPRSTVLAKCTVHLDVQCVTLFQRGKRHARTPALMRPTTGRLSTSSRPARLAFLHKRITHWHFTTKCCERRVSSAAPFRVEVISLVAHERADGLDIGFNRGLKQLFCNAGFSFQTLHERPESICFVGDGDDDAAIRCGRFGIGQQR